MLMLRYPSRLGNMFIVNAGLAMYYLWQAISVVLAQVWWPRGAECVPPPARISTTYLAMPHVCSTTDVVIRILTTSCGFGGLVAVCFGCGGICCFSMFTWNAHGLQV